MNQIMNDEQQMNPLPQPRRPWIEPEVSDPKSLVGTPGSLILQAASGTLTLDFSGGPAPDGGGAD